MEIERTPLLFQTTPAVAGGVVGNPVAHAVDVPVFRIAASSDSGIVHLANCPFCT